MSKPYFLSAQKKPASPVNNKVVSPLQRKCACGGRSSLTGECGLCRRRRLVAQPGLVQNKLRVGSANDRHEQEAEWMAAHVMQQPLKEEGLREEATSIDAPQMTPELEGQIDRLQGKGQSLNDETRLFMEERFGRDFSEVRIHTSTSAGMMSQRLNARAFTFGRHVFFAPGEHQPHTERGRRLLAHELTHVVQQSGGVHAGLTAAHQPLVQRQQRPGAATQPRGPNLVVVAHGASADAVRQARIEMNRILGNLAPANRARLRGVRIEMHIIPHNRRLTDLAPFAHLRGTRTFDGRLWDDVRGIGGIRSGNVIRYAVAEEQLVRVPGSGTVGGVVGGILGGLLGGATLGGIGALIGMAFGPAGALIGAIAGGVAGLIGGAIGGAFLGAHVASDPGYARGFAGIHESGHIVETFALTPAQRRELQRLFAARRRARGPWLRPENYTSANADEYFAQSVAAYNNQPYSNSATDRRMYTREWLRRNDPGMYRLLRQIFP